MSRYAPVIGPFGTARNSIRYTGVSSLIGPACAARRRSASRSGSPQRRTSTSVIEEKGMSSTDRLVPSVLGDM